MSATAVLTGVEQRATRRISRRLLPFLFVLYVIAFLDRVNVGYAGLEMSRDLNFSDRVFGLGAGIFSIGYFLFEIPGALIVERWSARKWMARILVTWGLVTILMAAVRTPRQFYLARFLLGVAEAGFFPGIVVYLTHWFRYEDRAKAGAIFMAAIPMSNIIGSPLAGWILSRHWAGISSWRWLFIAEGIPAILFGILTLIYLTDWPHQARWLAPDERAWIEAELQREKAAKSKVREWTMGQAMRSKQVILLTLVYFFAIIGIYGFVIWFPTIVQRATNLPNMAVTLLSALPYVAGLAAMLWNGWHSDRTAERRWHTALPLFLGAGCLAIAIRASGASALGLSLHGNRGSVHDGVYAQLLGAAYRPAERVRRRCIDRLDQFRRQSGRLRGPVLYRLSADRYQFLRAGSGFPSGIDGPIGHAGALPARSGKSAPGGLGHQGES